jgi:general secretion pathway protein D
VPVRQMACAVRMHHAVCAFFLAVFVSALTGRADAAVVSALRVDATPSGGARVVIAFAGPPAQFRVAGAGSAEVTVSLAQTLKAANVPTNVQGTGPVFSVHFSSQGTLAQVAIRLVAPMPARVVTDASNIYVDVSVPAPAAAPNVLAPPAPSPAATAPPVVEVMPLKYADISEVVGILVAGQSIPSNDTFVPQPSQLAQTNSAFGGTFGGSLQPMQQVQPAGTFMTGGSPQQGLGQRINEQIAIDRRLNAIILSGTPSEVAALRAVIEKIDVPLPSVVLETEIVELTDNAAKALGIDFTNGGGPLASAQLEIRSFNTPTGAVTLQAAIFDIVSHGGGKLIARPRIVAQNGTPASILTGDAIPIITNITSFGASTVTQQQVQYVSVGVNLQIQPRITSDGFVTTHVFSEVSSVTGYVQMFPQISQRVATTSATVRDGESFVIGGLVRETELHSLDRIPGIGSLPIIGGLFRNRRESRTSTNLYIVITPHITQPVPTSK